MANPNIGNSDVLVDDIFYLAEPFFQDGVIAQAVDEVVTNRGVSYFSAAGNNADRAYESTNFAVANDSESFFDDRFHDFDPGEGVDTRQSITIDGGATVRLSLQWDDPFYTSDGVDTDLNIFLLESGTNNVVAGSTLDNKEAQIPVEVLGFTNPSDTAQEYDVAISLSAGAEPGRIKYVNFGSSVDFNEFGTNSPTIIGHAAAVNAQAIGAARYTTPTDPEFFTALGPTNILFNPDGTRKDTPEIRQNPDLTAINGTDNTFFGGSDLENNGFPNFFGTSAAAPHAAAIAALMEEANPDLSPQEVYDTLADTAIDIGSPGFDNLTGEGLIDALKAVGVAASTAGQTHLKLSENR
ncbi:conserved hypothetical protein [Hyella patelloides LEGE 07179]|uniref:Peptidase S8/S53 domain-containing protein n=1 Tax=Hyella patelloides LEGE 07179 TaxID=945734 RepID=A0A563W079_9CYAN|nr:S8 family serine peptidase [Hyella patelloides]VEP17118.1 conserved hypothetical protein [Hyella patelloides LEGE 07179]